MKQKDLINWFMYHKIHHLSRLGFTASKIAKYLLLDCRTVNKHLQMSDQEYERYLSNSQERNKILSSYENFVKDKLQDYPDTSTAQIYDWLKEFHPNLPQVTSRSVYNFVMFVRQKYNIPLVKLTREYFAVEELPYGEQAQVDFGEYNMRQSNGSRKKVRFFAMVLSRSRMKFIWFSDVPFTAQTVCQAHERAFAFFEGIPKTIVYDQDRTMLVDENIGDLILTSTFKQYTKSRKFNLHFCKKADPESKGKVENVIQYVKKNFLCNRVYSELETLNTEALAWLGRTANHLAHNYTKESPYNAFIIEKPHLKTYTPLIIENKENRMYHVRKTNTIAYKSNFYTLPMGTYQGPGTQVKIKQIDNCIEIFNLKDELLCAHTLSLLTGQTIANSSHKRDTSKSIDELISELSTRFTNNELAVEYLKLIKKTYPRYTRDQLQFIIRALVNSGADQQVADTTLVFCITNQLFNGIDFEQALMVFIDQSKPIIKEKSIVLLNKNNLEKAYQTPQKRDINDYEKIINPLN